MAKSDFVPRTDTEFLTWHDQFKAAMTANIATFGFIAADATAVNTDNSDIHTRVTTVNSTAATAKQAVADKNTSRTNVEKRARAYAGRIKAHPAYTEAFGALFGIIGAEDSTDLSTSQPTLKAVDKGHGVVELSFNKSISEGVNIYCTRPGDATAQYLARDTASPYVDNRPLLVAGKPEVREYKCVYVLNDAEIGNMSDEVVVNCAP